MKRFLKKETDDGKIHLYLDDSSCEDFVKLAETKDCIFEKSPYVVIATDDESNNRFFGIYDDKVFETLVPSSAHFEIIDDVFCYWFEKEYYAVLPGDEVGKAKVECLGGRSILYLGKSAAEILQMTEWNYFRQSDGRLKFFLNKKLVFGNALYSQVENYPSLGCIACLRADNYYDLYRPHFAVPIKGDTTPVREMIEREHVFIWNKPEQAWVLHKNSRLWGKNAMSKFANGQMYLYEVYADGRISLVISGDFYVGKDYICIDGMYYFLTSYGEVDFEHAGTKKGFWRGLKELFG